MHTHTDVSLCLSFYLVPLFEKVKYVLRQPHICPGIRKLQPSRRELSQPIRQLTQLRKGQCNFIFNTCFHTHTHTHTLTCMLVFSCLWGFTLIRLIPKTTNLILILNFNLNSCVSAQLYPHLRVKMHLRSLDSDRCMSIIKSKLNY